MEQVKNSKQPSSQKRAYSNYFEIQLDFQDFGKSRKEHYEICNRMLLKRLEASNREGTQFYSHISNDALIEKIKRSPKARPHSSFVWEHCATHTANGREGIMRLVLAKQHSPRSEYWRALHPNYKNRGGYHEWAIPNGAPADGYYQKGVNFKKISQLTPHELPHYFQKAVQTNKYHHFISLLERAKQLALTQNETQAILTQSYSIGNKGQFTHLLNTAVANGHMPFIKVLVEYFAHQYTLSEWTDNNGNTLAHIAAKNNRHQVLKRLKELDVDLTRKNKKNQTVLDIVKNRKFAACLPYALPCDEELPSSLSHDEAVLKFDEISNDGKIIIRNTHKPFRDPTFTFSNIQNKKLPKQQEPIVRMPNNKLIESKREDSKPKANYTFKDLLKKQYGEKTAIHLINKKTVPVKPPKQTVPSIPNIKKVINVPLAMKPKSSALPNKEAKKPSQQNNNNSISNKNTSLINKIEKNQKTGSLSSSCFFTQNKNNAIIAQQKSQNANKLSQQYKPLKSSIANSNASTQTVTQQFILPSPQQRPQVQQQRPQVPQQRPQVPQQRPQVQQQRPQAQQQRQQPQQLQQQQQQKLQQQQQKLQQQQQQRLQQQRQLQLQQQRLQLQQQRAADQARQAQRAAEQARQAAAERARQQAVDRARQQAADRARQQAADRARQQAADRARQQTVAAAERARQQTADRARQQIAERARQQAAAERARQAQQAIARAQQQAAAARQYSGRR